MINYLVLTSSQRWADNQHLAKWRGHSSTQREDRKLISGPSPTIKTRLLSFNRTQSRVVIGLLTGHNTWRRYLYLMGLTNNPSCRRCCTEKKPQLTFCVSVKFWFHSEMHIYIYIYMGSFFLDPQDIKNLSLGAIWNISKRTGLP